MRYLAVLLLLLAACANLAALRVTPLEVDLATRPMSCQRDDDCERKWGRVVQWMTQNSHWKIRNATDMLVTTEGPLDEPYLAYTHQCVG